MKKIIIAMAAVAAAFTMASCNKEQPVSPNENPTVGKSVITASIENSFTKTTLEGNDDEGYKVFWSEGDNLFVGDLDENFNFNNWIAEYTLEDSSAGSPKGAFSWHTGNTFIPLKESCQEPTITKGTMYVATHPFDLMEEENHVYLIWKTEQTYSATDRYIPMYAETEGLEDGTADFKFNNLGGMLRLTVKGSASIRSIRISAAEDEAMSGACLPFEDANGNTMVETSFELAYDFGDVFNYIILDCGKDGVRLTDSGTDFYISIPCHVNYDEDDKMVVDGYSDVTITLTDTEGRTCVKKLKNENGLVIERSKITTATFTASEFKENIPEGALPGKFSVSADKQVYFSQGNLWYGKVGDAQTATFNFEANQYDTTPASDGSWSADHISHFFWSRDARVAYSRDYNASNSEYTITPDPNDVFFTNETETTSKNDFTVNVGGTEQTGWSTLSTAEWQYLFNNRTDAASKVGYATVCAVKGIIILPDNFTDPKKNNNGSGAFVPNNNGSGAFVPKSSTVWDQNVYSSGDNWNAMETAGAVFLPAAGDRLGSDVFGVGDNGYYWSSTPSYSDFAYFVFFNSDDVSPVNNDDRRDGFSVRLVTECQSEPSAE